VFFWLACIDRLTVAIFRPSRRPALDWGAAGAFLGLSLLSKYHAVFLAAGTGTFLLSSSQHRCWLRRWEPYAALGVAAVLFAPVVWWNMRHDWISFSWQLGRGAYGGGLHLDWLLRNVGGQALWLLPWIWAALIFELFLGFTLVDRDEPGRLFACLAAWPIFVFTAVSVYAPIGFHFHWQAPGYLSLFLLLGESTVRRLRERPRFTKACIATTTALGIASMTLLTWHSATGGWRRWGPTWLAEHFGERSDPTLETVDYRPLAKALADHGLLQEPKLFLFTNRWFQSGKVDFALHGAMPVECLNPFDPRSFAFFDRPDLRRGWDGVLVSTKPFLDRPEEWYGGNFDRFESLGEIPIGRGGEVEEILYLYRCRNYHTPVARPYGVKEIGPAKACASNRDDGKVSSVGALQQVRYRPPFSFTSVTGGRLP
jgi:hypothetical protein